MANTTEKTWKSGDKAKMLTLIEPLPLTGLQKFVRWRCVCECGEETIVPEYHLGKLKSCGCALPGHDTLCWRCQNATDFNACPWVDRFEPVNGWTAKETDDGWVVRKCPLFKKESKKQTLLDLKLRQIGGLI